MACIVAANLPLDEMSLVDGATFRDRTRSYGDPRLCVTMGTGEWLSLGRPMTVRVVVSEAPDETPAKGEQA